MEETTQNPNQIGHYPLRGVSRLLSGSHASFRLIPLTQGKFAIVDDEDYDWLMQWKWHIKRGSNTFYAVRNGKRPHRQKILMHREIINPPKGFETDHINHRGFDNRKINMRCCTHAQNNRNRLSKFNRHKGIVQRKNRWYARIWHNCRYIYLGTFSSKNEAIVAYDTKALELNNDFAYTNLSASAPTAVYRRMK